MFFSREDIEAWKEATRGVKRFLNISDPEIAKKPEESVSQTNSPIREMFHVKQSKRAAHTYVPDLLEGQASRMDKNAFSRLKKGNIRPHIVEDLHGMSLQSAKEHFYELVTLAHAAGNRSILLITGKGFEAPGKIRSAIPSWINDPDLKPLILAYCHATPKDGGKGAFYIYLCK